MRQLPRNFSLEGKAAFVTGGGTGLGYCMAKALCENGARVMIAGRREGVLDEAACSIVDECGGGEVLIRSVDLSDRQSLEGAASYAKETMNGIDIFIGNAARQPFVPIIDMDDATIDDTFQVNILSNMMLCRAFIPHMVESQWGRIIFSSSITAQKPTADVPMSAYAATKGAINTYVHAIANEYGRQGITANSLILGVWLTDLFEAGLNQLEPDVARQIKSSFETMTSLGRLAEPYEVEGIVQLLASDAGSYITAANLVVDGGIDHMLKPNPL